MFFLKMIAAVLLFFCSIQALWAQGVTANDVADLPPDHPGYGMPYHKKDFHYWRGLDDNEWEMDPHNQRFSFDLQRGVFRHQEIEAGVKPENYGRLYPYGGEVAAGGGRAPSAAVRVRRFLSPTTADGNLNFTFVLATVCGLILVVVFVLAYRRRNRYLVR